MNKEIKSNSNNSQSFNSSHDKKSAGCNNWTSVPRLYDKEESTHKHEKTATDNQWTSTSK